jgi:asparagine synthase (glutamine-hydrolysing)
MCGIAGYIGPNDPEINTNIVKSIAHRGPDGQGCWSSSTGEINFCHVRLSIIDIDYGTQPMRSHDNRFCITYNGEVYNHAEIRAELIKLGHRFSTPHSDTEVIIEAYRAWGEHAPLKFNGMFAFAIYDSDKNEVFLARDRFGEKPLYITKEGVRFGFASEVKALTKLPWVGNALDASNLQRLFAYGYLPLSRSIYKNTEKLPAGFWMKLHLKTGKRIKHQYWNFELNPDSMTDAQNEDEISDELAHLIEQAVRRRSIGDVPVGAFLSGGLDSSAIAIALSNLGQSTECFTIGFDEKSFDETHFAKLVARHVGLPHFCKNLNLEDAKNEISNVLFHLDEPFADPSILPTSLLSSFARTRVKVALTGDGADELFAGYDPFHALRPAALYSRYVPKYLHYLLKYGVKKLPISDNNMSIDFKLRRMLQGLSYDEQFWAPAWMAPLDPNDFKEIFYDPLDIEELYSDALEIWESNAQNDRVSRLLSFFVKGYLTDNILMKADRASMRFGLEARTVFLDNDLVSFAQKLPVKFKFSNGETKRIMKFALKKKLPHQIIDRKKKGFGVPINKWLRSVPEVVPMKNIDGVDLGGVEKYWTDHRNRCADNRLFLWTWLSLQYSMQ